MISVKIQKCCN